MTVEIRTQTIKPQRQTFGHLARRFGDKPSSRYQEATYDLQSVTNRHYKPLWEPDLDIYDQRRTAVRMADWYALKDPRNYYYATYTAARAKAQEALDAQMQFAEQRGLLRDLPEAARDAIVFALVPLRHYEWGANMNNCYCVGYGYGTAITQACMFAAMDRLGLAQVVSRIGLLLDGNQGAALEVGKAAWLTNPAWQGVRRVMENTFVTKDWFELYLVQNLVFDGLLLPLIYRHYMNAVNPRTGNALAMLTEFSNDWADETARWVDASVKTAADESPANARQLSAWYVTWRDEIARALEPLATLALGDNLALAGARVDLDKRAAKLGLAVL